MDNAQLYTASNALQKRDVIAVLGQFLPQLRWNENEENVLDIGCGSGDITKTILFPLLPENIRRVVGIDLSSKMVDFATKNFSHNLIEYFQMDIMNVNNPRQVFPEGFTKITSFYCLHWIQNQESCLRNMHHLLVQEGQALLVFLASNPIFSMYEKMSQKPKWKEFMTDVSNYIPVYQYKEDPEQVFNSLAEDIGFEVHFCKALERTFPFENLNYLKKALSAVNPFVGRIPSNEIDIFLNECIEELLAICPRTGDGGVVANYKLMVTVLQKTDSDIDNY